MRVRPAAIVVALALAAGAYGLLQLRHAWITAITEDDAPPTDPAALPGGDGSRDVGLPPAKRTRVVLIDGLSADTAHALAAWGALCDRGTRLSVDVGFPTVSLPVQFALWSGLTQQQTGVVDNGHEVARPPPPDSIPSQIADSWALAEDHGFIVRSLGFRRADTDHAGEKAFDHTAPPSGGAAGAGRARTVDDAWAARWEAAARDAVASPATLVFVHVLRVDHAGHRFGADSPEYGAAAREADALLATLVTAAGPDARWFALSDHGHLPGGGHGGEEREVRQVEACIAGPGVPHRSGGPVHIVDIARALADSTSTHLAPASLARPLDQAIAAPLSGDQAVPRVALTAGALAVLVLAVGLAISSFGVRRWWLAPWWLPLACISLVALRGEPTLSTPMTYSPLGLDMAEAWLPAVLLAALATAVGVRRTTLSRTVLAQLALPVAALAAAITACGGWHTLFGADIAPVVPRLSAWASALFLMTAHGALAVALALLATSVQRASDPPARPAPPRSAKSAAP